MAVCLLATACVATAGKPNIGADPSDANARVPPVGYRPATAGYHSQRPVEPAPWREQNERIAPAPK